jgi:hypothetical protein
MLNESSLNLRNSPSQNPRYCFPKYAKWNFSVFKKSLQKNQILTSPTMVKELTEYTPLNYVNFFLPHKPLNETNQMEVKLNKFTFGQTYKIHGIPKIFHNIDILKFAIDPTDKNTCALIFYT